MVKDKYCQRVLLGSCFKIYFYYHKIGIKAGTFNDPKGRFGGFRIIDIW